MGARPHLQYRAIRAVLRFGADVRTSKLCRVTSTTRSNVVEALRRAARSGYINIVGKGDNRNITVLKAGHQFLEDFERDSERLANQRKVPMIHTGKSKARDCLMCLRPFPSGGPGERICRDCKHTVEWTSPAISSHVAQEVT